VLDDRLDNYMQSWAFCLSVLRCRFANKEKSGVGMALAAATKREEPYKKLSNFTDARERERC